jgi:hypothetical protein
MKVKVMTQLSRNPEKESMRTQGAQICDGYCESHRYGFLANVCVCLLAGVHSFIHFTTLLCKPTTAACHQEEVEASAT